MRNLKTEQAAPIAPAAEQSRFRRWLIRRTRQLAFASLIVTGVLLVGVCVVALKRTTVLIGLPDVGDPFDVAAFRAVRVPDDHDALVLFREAASKLSAASKVNFTRQGGSTMTWAQANPSVRAYLESNRPALALFRQASLRPDASPSPVEGPFQLRLLHDGLGRLVRLVILDASRLEAEGDMKAAWDEYHSILRLRAVVMRAGTAMDRHITNGYCAELRPRVVAWATDPRTEVSLIRRALSDVQSLKPNPEWDAHSLKIDYLQAMTELDHPDEWAWAGADEEILRSIGGPHLPMQFAGFAYGSYRILINEPERSRRVLRLAFANWLAHVHEKQPANRKPFVRAVFEVQKQTTYVPFYAVAPDAPAAVRAMSAEDLARWVTTARDARVLLWQWPWPTIRTTELREYGALTISLAEELYRRDRGSLPPSEQALVGTYLEQLPDDGSSELDDGTAQRVEESMPQGPGLLE